MGKDRLPELLQVSEITIGKYMICGQLGGVWMR